MLLRKVYSTFGINVQKLAMLCWHLYQEDRWSWFISPPVHPSWLIYICTRWESRGFPVEICFFGVFFFLRYYNCFAGWSISSSILTVLMVATEAQEHSIAGSLPCAVPGCAVVVGRGAVGADGTYWFVLFKKRNWAVLLCQSKCRPLVNIFCLPDRREKSESGFIALLCWQRRSAYWSYALWRVFFVYVNC